MQTVDGRLIVVGGASRSGKTAYVRKATAKSRRVCVWDIEAQWCELPGWRRITSRAALWDALQMPGPFKIAFVSGGDLRGEFDYWARAVLYAGRYVGPLEVVAEELADVTSPAKAPGHWGILLRRGLKRGVTIYAISQRWQEADKTAFDNASEYVFFRQANPKARAYVSDSAGIALDQIPTVPLHFVKKDAASDAIQRGKLTF